jgi:putative membrane protein
MMWYGNGWMFGMHFLWWGFWPLLILILVVVLLRRETGPPPPISKSTPLETLERRYAAGEISTEEFEERRTHLLKRG